MPFWLIKGVIFLKKLKISEIQMHNFAAGAMKSLYTGNQLMTIPLLISILFKRTAKIATRKSKKKLFFNYPLTPVCVAWKYKRIFGILELSKT